MAYLFLEDGCGDDLEGGQDSRVRTDDTDTLPRSRGHKDEGELGRGKGNPEARRQLRVRSSSNNSIAQLVGSERERDGSVDYQQVSL